MIIKSLENPVYYRRKKGGLAGNQALKIKPASNDQKTFEEYLTEAFQGEVVQTGFNFSKKLSDLTIRNLKKI
jgi:hypothetical protein